jgi:prepilin-type N-terminal cleavage/methylation domain-containing protein
MEIFSMRRADSHRGFTIVELLCVVGAIAILLGVLLVGLQSASRMTSNVRSMNRLKQLHMGWSTYSNAYEDRLLPGYISSAVQQRWRVRYQDPHGDRLDADECETYPWRLLPYLDFELDPMYGYRSDVQEIQNNYANEEAPDHHETLTLMSRVPAFGYNAYYVGGWWEMDGTSPHLVYGNTPVEILIGTNTRSVRGRLVAQSHGDIRQPEQLIAFCSSTFRSPGAYTRQENNPDGAAWVVPQRLCTNQIWQPFTGDVQMDVTATLFPLQAAGEGIEVLQAQAVPLRRHGITVPIVNCDGSTTQAGIDELMMMDRWTGAAIDAPGRVDLFSHPCDEGSGAGIGN